VRRRHSGVKAFRLGEFRIYCTISGMFKIFTVS